MFREEVIRYIDSYQYLFTLINLTICGLGADGSNLLEVSDPILVHILSMVIAITKIVSH